VHPGERLYALIQCGVAGKGHLAERREALRVSAEQEPSEFSDDDLGSTPGGGVVPDGPCFERVGQ